MNVVVAETTTLLTEPKAEQASTHSIEVVTIKLPKPAATSFATCVDFKDTLPETVPTNRTLSTKVMTIGPAISVDYRATSL